MNLNDTSSAANPNEPAARATARNDFRQYLMKPLGTLSLVVVACDVVAKAWLNNDRQDWHAGWADLHHLRLGDVLAWVAHVEHVAVHALGGAAQILVEAPMMACTSAVALLVTGLLRRVRKRGADIAQAGVPTGAATRDSQRTVVP